MTRTAILLLCATVLCAQPDIDPAPGTFLIAKRTLPDPNFTETVILLIHYDAKSAMGVVINDPSEIPLAKLYPQAKNKKDRLYIGGPVQQMGAQVLLRSKTKPDNAKPVLADIYLTTDTAFVDKAIETGDTPIRVYLGYSGWGPRQLDREIEAGAWHVVKADPNLVFDPDPSTVWERALRKTNPRIAYFFSAPNSLPRNTSSAAP